MSTPSASFSQPEPGLFIVEYTHPDQLLPENTNALIAALVLASKTRPVTLICEASPDITRIPIHVSTYWLKMIGRRDVDLRAIAGVTTSSAIQLAARAFEAGCRALNRPTRASTFPNTRSALEWARSLGTEPSLAKTG